MSRKVPKKFYGLLVLVFTLFLVACSNEEAATSTVDSSESSSQVTEVSSTELEEEKDPVPIDVSKVLDANGNPVDADLLDSVLYIPSIDLEEPIYKILDDYLLMLGATVIEEGIGIDEGNYSVAGHNNYSYLDGSNLYFEPFDDLEKGAIIRITDNEYLYEFEYVDFKVVHLSEVHMLDQDKAEPYGAPIVSLMRCEIENGLPNEMREFFIGKLVNKEPVTPEAFYAPDPKL